MKPSRQNAGWIWLAAALVAVASIWFFARGIEAERAVQERLMRDRGNTVLNALAAGLRAQTRMGRYRLDRINAILEELAATPGIIAVELRAPDGELLASGGDKTRLASVPREAFAWQGTACVASKDAVICGGGPGRNWHAGQEEPDARPLPEGACMLAVALDGGDAVAAVQRARQRSIIGAVATVAALFLGAWAASTHTRRRRLETELAATRDQAHRQEELTQMGAGLAHETKNPLGIVRGIAQSIEQAPDTPSSVKRLASQIIDETDRTVGQINGFLSLARPKKPAKVVVDLDAFLDAFVDLVRPEANAKSVSLEASPSAARIEADPELLRRSLLNMVINALRATQPGGHIVVAYHEQVLSVSDDGCGISPEDLPHVTEPYFGRFEGGSGLGLAIVEQIARAHGWSLDIVSSAGGGTRACLCGIASV